MAANSSLLDLETLFIEKLQEKYKLNKKDLKRAFSKFDKDNNGLLDLYELTKGIQLFLNGVKESQVQKLVSKYDKNGDGKISYDEFLYFLTNRTAFEEGDDESEYSRPSSAGNGGVYYNKGGKLLRQAEAQRNMPSPAKAAGPPGRAPALQNYPPTPPPANYPPRAPAYVDEDIDQMTDDFDASELGDHYSVPEYPPQNNHPSNQRPPVRGAAGRPPRSNVPNLPNHRSINHIDQGYPVDPYSDLGSARSEYSEGSRVSTPGSEAPSAMDPHDPREIQARVKIFMDNLKTYLAKQAGALRMGGQLDKAVAHMPAAEMRECVGRDLLKKAFQRYTGQGEGKAREQFSGVEAPEFAKVLRGFKFPGAAPLRTETIGFLFDLCSLSPIEGDHYVNEEGRVVADPNILTDLLYGAPTNHRDIKARGLNKVGSTAPNLNLTDSQTGRPIKGYVSMMQAGRDVVGSGPVALPSATDEKAQKALDMLRVPLRFVSPKSRTVMAVPSNFDPICSIGNSNKIPGYDLVRKHVFGMSSTSYSGNTLYTLPSTPSAFAHGRGSGGNTPGRPNTLNRNNPDFIDPATIVYATAGLGVVHNLSENKQLFFDAHTDDITCITVSADGTYAATGQMGKSPMVHLWATDIPPGQSNKPINTIHNNFFSRGVCALAFSYDNKYIVCIGCDDKHAMGIFDTSTTALIIEAPAQNGIPPQIKWMDYCAGQQHTEYITREHAGLCDLFATAGEHHLKIWSFRRPTKDAPASLNFKSGAMGKSSVTAAKAYLCCAFVACEDRTFDLVTGGSNGMLYLFRAGTVVAVNQAFKSKVRCLVVGGDRVYCGGGGGMVKILDARTLTVMQSFNLLPLDSPASSAAKLSSGLRNGTKVGAGAGLGGIGSANKSGSASGSRPRAASAGPTSRRALTIKPRADLHAPKHAAGNPNSGAGGSAGDAISGAYMRSQDDTASANEDDEGSGSKVVTGIAVVRGAGRVAAAATYLIVALGNGKVVRLDVGNAIGGAASSGLTPRPGTAGTSGASLAVAPNKELFHYHTGPVYGLAADVTQENRLFATVCDDRKLMVWDAKDCVLIGKTALQTPSRCCHIDKTSSFIAVGATSGAVTVHYLADTPSSNSHHYRLSEVAFRRDAKAEITEVKFSPNNDRIAAGCRDDCIYVYGCELEVLESGNGRNVTKKGSCVLRAMHRLRGHSSTITHLDWSYDSQLIRSTCAAYELLCWDAETGRLNTTANVSDVKWRTHHCVLGFHVMGIWPPYADGTDINAVDAVPHKCLIATANDQGGLVRLHHYPCVVRHAPGKEYPGHSSHVTNLRFMRDGELMMTTGGNDRSVVVWEVRRDESLNNTDTFRR